MTKSFKKKVFSFLGVSISGIIIGLIISFYLMLRFSLPVTDGEKRIAGISDTVTISFDQMGIPQIWAESEPDAYFALGYQHAADRMFQMDLARRIAQGKLSEMLGGIATAIDRQQVTIGHHRIARRYLDKLSEENRLRLQAYSDGVNGYYRNCSAIPFEYRFLPVGFEPWTVFDCLALLSFQTWFSNALMNQDQFANDLIEQIGLEKARDLLFSYPEWAPTTVEGNSISSSDNRYPINSFSKLQFKLTPDSKSNFVQRSIAERYFTDGQLPFLFTEASNAWVVAPSRSESGMAMLASDPHLELGRLPQFWYAAGIHIKDKQIDAFGITTPGLPFFVMGHNGKAAYAFTAGGNDVIDYTILELNKENSNQYMSGNGWKSFEPVEEITENLNDDTLSLISIQKSDYGIIIEKDSSHFQAYAMYWVGFDVDLDRTVTNAFQLVSITDFKQFRRAVTNFGALDANYLYADINGTIGYQLSTPLLKRKDEDENIPQNISSATSQRNYYPLDKTPFSSNPERGWIASCNNLPQRNGKVRGHYFANRILSIAELLESKELFTINDMYHFQFDRKDRYLKSFFPLYTNSAFALEVEEKKEMYYKLLRWDGAVDISSEEAAFVVIFFDQLKRITFEDELGELYHRVPAKWIEHIDSLESTGWFDDVNSVDTVETLKIAAQKAWLKAFELSAGKTWGQMQTIQMQHPMAVIPVLGSLLKLSSPIEPYGGTAGSLNASFSSKSSDSTFSSVAGPSMRFVIDFADPDGATIVLPSGNSGNPMSEHFFDFYEMWKKNERWNVPLSYEKVMEKAVSRLTLYPEVSDD